MTRLLVLLAISLLFAACGGDDEVIIIGPTATVPVSTATLALPTVTRTVPPPSSTATSVPTSTSPPTSTATLPPTATVTFTATVLPPPITPTPTVGISEGATALFHVDPLDPGNPFPTNRLLDDTG